MAANDAEQTEYLEEGDEEQGAGALQWLQNTPYWAISAVLHLIVVLIAMNVIWEEERKKEKESPVVVHVKPNIARTKPYDPTLKRDMVRRPKVPGAKTDKTPVILKKPDEVTPDIPKGTSLDNITNVNIANNTSINDAIGIGGGAAGAYGERWGKGSLAREGGSDGSEEAVRAALEWLRRHQHPDGFWSSKLFTERCASEGKPCAHKDPDTAYSDGRGWEDFDVGVTALAMLAYLGYGHTHRSGEFPEYVEVLNRAYKWMLKQQVKSDNPTENGRYGGIAGEQWIYCHAISTMAMGELLFMSKDKINLQKSVQDATEWCIRSQNEGYGWKYGYRAGKNDTSVTGWMVLALKTSKACAELNLIQLRKDDVTNSLKGALAWFARSTSQATGKTGYETAGDDGSTLLRVYPDPYPFSKSLSCMTAVGVLCRIFAGELRSSEPIKKGVRILMAEPPEWKLARGKTGLSKINMYYWYYATYAMFQYGGPDWKKWNDAMLPTLLDSQRVGGCEDGSWDPIDEWGPAGGRVYSTAINAMTLEVYYRFTRAQ